jgi:hypothetical protein
MYAALKEFLSRTPLGDAMEQIFKIQNFPLKFLNFCFESFRKLSTEREREREEQQQQGKSI